VERKLNISQARAELLSLARHLNANPHDVVVLEHRDLDEPLVLTSARHLRSLERLIQELRKPSNSGFRLAGSGRSLVSDEEVEDFLQETRQRWVRERPE
jgi:hypothetical protein